MKRMVIHKRPKTLILSPKAQLVLGLTADAVEKLREFQQLRDDYLRMRDARSINRITTAEIELMGVEAALMLAIERAHGRRRAP